MDDERQDDEANSLLPPNQLVTEAEANNKKSSTNNNHNKINDEIEEENTLKNEKVNNKTNNNFVIADENDIVESTILMTNNTNELIEENSTTTTTTTRVNTAAASTTNYFNNNKINKTTSASPTTQRLNSATLVAANLAASFKSSSKLLLSNSFHSIYYDEESQQIEESQLDSAFFHRSNLERTELNSDKNEEKNVSFRSDLDLEQRKTINATADGEQTVNEVGDETEANLLVLQNNNTKLTQSSLSTRDSSTLTSISTAMPFSKKKLRYNSKEFSFTNILNRTKQNRKEMPLDQEDLRNLKSSKLFFNWSNEQLREFIEDERVYIKKSKYKTNSFY